MGVNIFNDSIIGCKMGTDTIDAIYQGTELLYSSVPPQPKWVATYLDSSTTSADCDVYSNTISEGDVTLADLISIEIGSCVAGITNYAFSGCTSLTSVVFQDGIQAFLNDAFAYCINLTSLDLPDSVTSIGGYAFTYCNHLSSVTIGSGIRQIKQSAFMYCSSLSSIIINAEIPPTLGRYAFDGTNDCPIYVPSKSVSDYQTEWSAYADRIQAIT